MREAIHIFKKDVRHLWPAILAVLILTVLFAYAGAFGAPVFMPNSSSLDQLNFLIQMVMPLAWWYLIAATIHEEALPGHHQFWLTRPYSWKSLLAAKTLFILAFVNIPKLLADFVILHVQGFGVISYWPNLIAWQILFTAVWLLPFAAMAAVTKNLRQFIFAVVVLWIVIVLLPSFFLSRSPLVVFFSRYWIGATWLQNFIIVGILLVASLLIIVWQYSRRRTTLNRMIAAVAVILLLVIPQLLPLRAVMAMQNQLSKSRVDGSPIRITMDPTRKRRAIRFGGPQGAVRIDIPVEVTALAEGMDLYADDLTVEIEGPDGTAYQAAGTIGRGDDGFWQTISVELTVFERLKDEQVTVRTSASLTVLGDQKTMRLEPQERATEVPGLGLCRFSQHGDQWTLVCYSPFRRPSRVAKTYFSNMHPDAYTEPGSYSPYPAEAGISPLVVSVRGNGSHSGGTMTPTIVTEAPLAHSRCDFEIRGVRLADYAIK